jgi:ankyrin repeat protein
MLQILKEFKPLENPKELQNKPAVSQRDNDKFMLEIAQNNIVYAHARITSSNFNQNHYGKKGSRPIHWALDYGRLGIARLLLENNFDYGEESLGGSILIQAAKKGYNDIIDLILPKVGDTEAVVRTKKQCLEFKSCGGEALLAALSDAPESKNVNFVENGHSLVAHQLIKAGADVNNRSTEGDFTPLMFAAYYGYTSVVHALVQYKADLDCVVENWSALSHAMFTNKLETTAAILEYNPKLPPSDHPIWECLKEPKYEQMNALLHNYINQRAGQNKRKAENDENGAGFFVNKRHQREALDKLLQHKKCDSTAVRAGVIAAWHHQNKSSQ